MQEKQSKKDLDIQKRIENYEVQRSNMLELGYTEHIGTISILKANLLAFVTAGPIAILAIIIYIVVWKEFNRYNGISETIYLLVAFLICIPIHEAIHGITWHLFCKNKWKSIQFGVMWKSLTPYCYCEEPLKFGSYLAGCLMPFVVLGIVLSALGIASHNNILVTIGALNILSAGGDTTISCMLFKYRKCVILDHPSECGFVAFRKEG